MFGLLQLRSLLSSAWEAQISEPMDSVREGDRGHCAYFCHTTILPNLRQKKSWTCIRPVFYTTLDVPPWNWLVVSSSRLDGTWLVTSGFVTFHRQNIGPKGTLKQLGTCSRWNISQPPPLNSTHFVPRKQMSSPTVDQNDILLTEKWVICSGTFQDMFHPFMMAKYHPVNSSDVGILTMHGVCRYFKLLEN